MQYQRAVIEPHVQVFIFNGYGAYHTTNALPDGVAALLKILVHEGRPKFIHFHSPFSFILNSDSASNTPSL
jgi:hypothetical protein